MGQVSSKLRNFRSPSDAGFSHWCPGCKEMHNFWTEGSYVWQFDGNLEAPTVSPSIKHSGLARVKDENGHWLGGWIYDDSGKPIPEICHYFLCAGKIEYCGDCSHSLAGKTVDLPDLPPELQDNKG